MRTPFPEALPPDSRVSTKLAQAHGLRHAQAMKRRRCLPVFRFNKAFGIVQDVKKFLNRKRIKSKRRELSQIDREHGELRAAKAPAGGIPDGGQPAPQAADGSETGALPDFIIIGGKKCGTTFLYNLLTQHPHVEPAAKKELHYFDTLFGEGIEWYRRCFPPPRWKDGRRTFTGEGTPYLHRSSAVPERMAEMLPQARLIALLRNPADRAYSDYQQKVRKGRET